MSHELKTPLNAVLGFFRNHPRRVLGRSAMPPIANMPATSTKAARGFVGDQ
jgi:signal transduction histidine kinase